MAFNEYLSDEVCCVTYDESDGYRHWENCPDYDGAPDDQFSVTYDGAENGHDADTRGEHDPSL